MKKSKIENRMLIFLINYLACGIAIKFGGYWFSIPLFVAYILMLYELDKLERLGE